MVNGYPKSPLSTPSLHVLQNVGCSSHAIEDVRSYTCRHPWPGRPWYSIILQPSFQTRLPHRSCHDPTCSMNPLLGGQDLKKNELDIRARKDHQPFVSVHESFTELPRPPKGWFSNLEDMGPHSPLIWGPKTTPTCDCW